MSENILIPNQEEQDEPPEPPSISSCWLRRVVASLEKNLSLRERRENSFNYNCIYRKSCFALGFIELHREK